MMIVSIDERAPKSLAEICENSIEGNYESRWLDKSLSLISFKNGKFGCNSEHACFDGPVIVGFSNFILSSFIEDENTKRIQDSKSNMKPRELKFDVDEKILKEIKRIQERTKSFKDSVKIKVEEFKLYGKNVMKNFKVHPDCYVQMALQLAYFKLHGKLAPTYETGTMRVFYHGRTETVRSCSIEVKNWLDKMCDGKTGVRLKFLEILK